jgi:hypothetical protein
MEDGVCNKNNVEQPPSAVSWQGAPILAKPAKNEYRRNLPHLQAEDKPVYLTFCTYKRWRLPTSVRSLIIRHCLHDHGTKLQVHGLVVMPDHVHMIFSPQKGTCRKRRRLSLAMARMGGRGEKCRAGALSCSFSGSIGEVKNKKEQPGAAVLHFRDSD